MRLARQHEGYVSLIRRAVSADAEAIAEVHIATWMVAYRGQLPDAFLASLAEGRTRRVAAWRAALESEEQRVFVAERDGRVVGFAHVGRSRDPDPTGPGEVYAIYVHPDAWDTGTGRDLMRAGLRELRQLGYREAMLWVLATNERARRFYESCGWRPDGADKIDRRGDVALHEVRYRIALAASG